MAVARRLVWLVTMMMATGCAPQLPSREPLPPSLVRATGARELVADGRVLRDRLGRAVILRGVNLDGTSKLPPFAALRDLGQLDPLPALGVNVLRLPIMWEAVEPAPGRYDEAQLAALEAIVDAAWARGIYVIVDVHQDAYSRFVGAGCGSGFPRWALPPELTATAPKNDGRCLYWGIETLFEGDVSAAWQAFHADRGGVRGRYLQLLGMLARRFARHAGVIGYDLLNEPGGDEERDVGPLYRDAAAAVRAVDAEALLLVEPSAAVTSLGLGQRRLPRLAGAGVVYSPHYYDFTLNLWGQWSGSRWVMRRAVAKMDERAAAWNVPLFVGELGAPARGWRAGEYVVTLWEELDRLQASGAQWVYAPLWTAEAKDGWNREDFSIVDERGGLRANFAVRPYPQRVAGAIESFAVAPAAGTAGAHALTVRWRNDSDAPTVLFAPRALFPQGRVDASVGVTCAWAADALHVACTSQLRGEVWARIEERQAR